MRMTGVFPSIQQVPVLRPEARTERPLGRIRRALEGGMGKVPEAKLFRWQVGEIPWDYVSRLVSRDALRQFRYTSKFTIIEVRFRWEQGTLFA